MREEEIMPEFKEEIIAEFAATLEAADLIVTNPEMLLVRENRALLREHIGRWQTLLDERTTPEEEVSEDHDEESLIEANDSYLATRSDRRRLWTQAFLEGWKDSVNFASTNRVERAALFADEAVTAMDKKIQSGWL